MKRILQKTAMMLVLVLVVATLTAPSAFAKKPWEKFKYPELGEIVLPEYERVELDNGMVLYLAEDHSLPMIQLSATIQAGGIYAPQHLTGLAPITGEVLRTGGTAKWTGDEIDEIVEAMGSTVETWVGDATGGAYLSALTEDADQALEILAEILMNPQFADEKIELSKSQHKAGIARRNDEPMQIARREFMRMIFGPDHPMAWMEEYDTIGAITRADLVEFHRNWFGPDRTWLVVIGDFDAQAMTAKIEQAFAGWAPAAMALPADPEIPAFPRTVNVAPKEDLTQSNVILGHKGIRNDHPDYAAIQVANRILGGGFSSRLFNEVRSVRGLAYSTGSAPGTGWRFPGVFVAFAGTKSESTEQAAEVIIQEIERMTTELVTEKELQVAVDGILNSDVFNYDTKREVLDRMVLFEMNGYENSFLADYRAAVQGMTAERILEACRNVWKPADLSILAVGNPADFDGDLSKFGPVNEIDITIPEPKMTLEIPAATEESLAAGQSLLTNTAKAMGRKIAGMTSYKTEQTWDVEIQGMALSIDIGMTMVQPSRLYMTQKLPFGEQIQALDGDTGWASGMGQVQDLPGDAVAKLKQELEQNFLFVLADPAKYSCQALEQEELDGVLCDRVYIDYGSGDYLLVFLNAETGLPCMEQSKGEKPMTQEPAVQKVVHGEYQDFGGVKRPATFTVLFDDEEFAAGTTKSFQVAPKVDDALFAKD